MARNDDFVTVQVTGLRELHRKLKDLDVKTRSTLLRRSMRPPMESVRDRAKVLAKESEDTGGLLRSIRLSGSSALSRLKKQGRNAVVVVSVFAGYSRQREGVTGHQALQIEFGTSHSEAKPFLRPALQGQERRVISQMKLNLSREYRRWVAKNRKKS